MDRSTTTNIQQAHCQSCGSVKAEDVSNLRDTEGYTRCCNERVVYHGKDVFGRTETCATSRDCYHD